MSNPYRTPSEPPLQVGDRVVLLSRVWQGWFWFDGWSAGNHAVIEEIEGDRALLFIGLPPGSWSDQIWAPLVKLKRVQR